MDTRFLNRTRERSGEDLKSKGRIESERQWAKSVKGVLSLANIYGKWVKWTSLSCVRLFATPWTIQSLKVSRPECWMGRFPFSRGSSQPRHWTQVSHTAGGFFISWATREAHRWEEPAFEGECSSLLSLLFTDGQGQIISLWTQQRHFSCIQAEGQYPLRQVIVCNDDSSKGKQADEAATTCSPNWCFSARAVGHGLHRAASGLSCPVACGILEIRPTAPAFFTAFSTTVPSGKPHEYTFWDLTFSTQCFSKGIMFSDLQTRWQVPLFLMEHV